MAFIQTLNKQKTIKSYTGNTTVLIYNFERSKNTFRLKKLLIFRKIHYFKHKYILHLVIYTTFTLESIITDSKLIWICFKTSSNSIYPFPTVYTRLSKRNDYFQFSRLHLYMIVTAAQMHAQNAATMPEISRMLRLQLFTLVIQNSKRKR